MNERLGHCVTWLPWINDEVAPNIVISLMYMVWLFWSQVMRLTYGDGRGVISLS